MAKALKKRLPKNFADLLKESSTSHDLTAIQEVFKVCDINARDGSSEDTALMMWGCSSELAEWLVKNGADVNAVNYYGRTALHTNIGLYNRCPPETLINLGADIHKLDRDGNSVLHCAAGKQDIDVVTLLLSLGAKVDVLNNHQFTPLEYALQRLSNINLVKMVPIAKTLLTAGTRSTPQSQVFVKKAAEEFEFHRAGFNKEAVEETSNAARELCELFQVEPPKVRQMHDGKSPIVAVGKTTTQQYESLWQILIPSSGACETVQGEVLRITGRVSHELLGNGGGNWDRDFSTMLHAWHKHLTSNHALDLILLTEAREIISLGKDCDDHIERMIELSLAWIQLNPTPIKLSKPTYKR